MHQEKQKGELASGNPGSCGLSYLLEQPLMTFLPPSHSCVLLVNFHFY